LSKTSVMLDLCQQNLVNAFGLQTILLHPEPLQKIIITIGVESFWLFRQGQANECGRP